MKNIFETLEILEKEIIALKEYELISLENAKNRTLTKNIYARKNLPSFDNSALDGYAFNFADLNSPLTIKTTIFAGDKNTYEINKNECCKIMTGAKIPKNADTILAKEDENLQDGKLIIKNIPKQGNAYRYKGEEVKEGELLIEAGTKLNSKHIALLASQGFYKIEVFRKIRIGIFSSGNELKEPWQECDELNIYNANAMALTALFDECQVSYLGILKDNFKASKIAINDTNFDLLLTSGGASVGEADFIEKALIECEFDAIFKGLKAKPSKVTKLYKKDNKLVLILPGNPMSAYFGAFIFGKKIINLLQNNLSQNLQFKAKMGMDLKLNKGRNNLILGNLKDGFFYPFNNNNFGSGMIVPLARSEFLFISDEEKSFYQKGEEINLLKI